jgi:hypothetical protein
VMHLAGLALDIVQESPCGRGKTRGVRQIVNVLLFAKPAS